MKFTDRYRLEETIKITFSSKKSKNPVWSKLFLILFCFLYICNPVHTGATGLDESLYVTNGTVLTIVGDATNIYLGGYFTSVSPKTGNGVVLNSTSGSRDTTFPEVAGDIYVVISDGEDPNGWYIGGEFTSVGGFAHDNFAHINSDGTVNMLFALISPTVQNKSIYAMVLDGNILYVAGEFENYGGSDLNGIMAIDMDAASVISTWNPNPSGGVSVTGIYSMVREGDTLYVAGDFSSIGGQTRMGIAALEKVNVGDGTGRAIADWNPNPEGGIVKTMALSGTTLYVGGTFTSIGGQTRSRIAAIDTVGAGDGTGRANPTWNPNVTGNSINELLISGTTLYAGGDFTVIGQQNRNNIAVLETVGTGDGTGKANGIWDPNITSSIVTAMALDAVNNRLYVGGNFSGVGGQVRCNVAMVDAVDGGDGSGSVDATFKPNANDHVHAITLSGDGNTLYMGGAFTGIGAFIRNGIAAINKTTGIATNWNPDANGRVNTMILSGNTLYVGGLFTGIGGQTRNRIAALDTTTDTNNARAWNPDSDGSVLSMLLNNDGSVLYVGGEFANIGGSARSRIAALDTTTNTNNAKAWNPDADNTVSTMLLNGTTLYVGGLFANIGGSTRNYIAALDTTTDTNNATSWNPGVSNSAGASGINTMALYETTLYVGGRFDNIGGSERNNIAALDTTTDTDNTTSWNPIANGAVHTMLISGSTLYVGGSFSYIWEGAHYSVAALDIARDSYIARTWNPVFYNGLSTTSIFSLALDNKTLYTGGDFSRIGILAGGNLARFNFTSPVTTALVTGGTYPREQFVGLSCEAADGFECDVTYYTIDGSEPTSSSNVIALGGVYIDYSATLKFFSIDNAGAVEEDVKTETYVIEFEDAVCFVETAAGSSYPDRIIELLKNMWKQGARKDD